ncbi:MAG TPA: hypothetical protein DEP42_05100 [Ruminococcaceae bacterium]|nr:hypothetical protein [Oscillospiraceae bacterium]
MIVLLCIFIILGIIAVFKFIAGCFFRFISILILFMLFLAFMAFSAHAQSALLIQFCPHIGPFL